MTSTLGIYDEYFKNQNEMETKFGKKTIVFMQVGSFYEVYAYKNKSTQKIYGSNIVDFVNICEFQMSEKKVQMKDENIGIMMAGFPDYQIDKYLEKMNSLHYTIVIYKQEKNSMGKITRPLFQIVSPGTYFTANSIENIGNDIDNNHKEYSSLSNNSVCICIEVCKKNRFYDKDRIIFGLSLINIINGKCNYSEHQIDTPSLKSISPSDFDYVERYISIYNPSELIILYNSEFITDKFLNSFYNYIGIHNKSIHTIDKLDIHNPFHTSIQKCEKQSMQMEILHQYYKKIDISYFMNICRFHEYSIACQSFVFLLEFIYYHNPTLIEYLQLPVMEYETNNLYLGNHSLKQLNIISNERVYGNKSSILDFMNRCVTDMGKRHFKEVLLHPITCVNTLNNRYNNIEKLMGLKKEGIQKIRKQLLSVIDMERLLRSIIIKNENTSFQHIQKWEQSLHVLHTIFSSHNKLLSTLELKHPLSKVIENIQNIHTYMSSNINNKYNTYDDIEEYKTDDIEGGKINNMLFFVKNYDQELDDMYDKYKLCVSKIHTLRDYLTNMIKEKSPIQTKKDVQYIRIHHMDKTGYYFKITNSRAKIFKSIIDKQKQKSDDSLKQNNDTLINDFSLNEITFQTATGSDKKISSPYIDELFNDIRSLRVSLMEKHIECYKRFLLQLVEMRDNHTIINEYVEDFDFTLSNSFHSIEYNYSKPIICNNKNNDNKSYITIEKGRHPLIEVLYQDEIYVHNDVSLTYDNRGMLIYGTNAVGKSSLIKSIGIMIILAQSGCFVPCSNMTYYPFHKLYTRILGNDNLFKGLSTFAVEMTELNVILRDSDEYSLVLGDELCSGTESGSAMSLFLAGLRYLDKNNVKYMFATHFHEITKMKAIDDIQSMSIKHMEVKYDKEKDILIYNRKLKDGPGNNIYGLEVCKSLKLPDDFLEDANMIRLEINPEYTIFSERNNSRYNSLKIKENCEICGKISNDIHHIQEQTHANEYGFIDTFHKNHKGNLLSICKKCHDKIHYENMEYSGKIKTSEGMMLYK